MKWLPLILLVAAQAQAAELQALILTGAATEAAAAPLLEAAKKRAEDAKTLLELAPGFPKVVQSDKVSGLKPGFWIVLAGFCEKDTVLTALKALDSGAYARPVQVEAAACPRVADGWTVTTEEAKDPASKRLLRGVLFSGGDWRLYTSLKEKSGALVAEQVIDSQDTACALGGGEPELKAKGGSLVMRVTDCLKPRGCPNPAKVTLVVTVSGADQAIKNEEKVLNDPGYRGCKGE